MPTAQSDIVETVTTDPRLGMLALALEATCFSATLRARGPFTVFAPLDAAFAALAPDSVEALFQDAERLSTLLAYHVLPARLPSTIAMHTVSAQTLGGGRLRIDIAGGLRVNDARVVQPDLPATNGVIHVIDGLLRPQ